MASSLSRDSPKRSSDAAQQQVSEELEWTPASESSKRARVYVAAAYYNVVGAQSTATTAFGQNAPELLVVALTCRLLVGSHRVAAEHAAAPSSAFETPALQALPIIELDSSID